jgi:hypothetical protein
MGISVGQETIMVANPSCKRENARVFGFIKKIKKIKKIQTYGPHEFRSIQAQIKLPNNMELK